MIFIMLYIISLLLIYLITGSFYLLTALLFHSWARKKTKGHPHTRRTPIWGSQWSVPCAALFYVAGTSEDIYNCWAHHEQLIHFLCQEYPSFPPLSPCPLCVPGEFTHVLDDPVQIFLSFCKPPCGPRQNELLLPGYAPECLSIPFH